MAIDVLRKYTQSSTSAQQLILPIIEATRATEQLQRLGSQIEEQEDFIALKYKELFADVVFKALLQNILDKCNGIDTSLTNFIQQEAQNEEEQLKAIEAQNEENCRLGGNCNLRSPFTKAKDIFDKVIKKATLPALCLKLTLLMPVVFFASNGVLAIAERDDFIGFVKAFFKHSTSTNIALVTPKFLYDCLVSVKNGTLKDLPLPIYDDIQSY